MAIIDKPELHFQTKTYTANGSANRLITLDGSENMQPDWVWLKNRNQAVTHDLYDSVRGATKYISSDQSSAEATNADGLVAFNTNGFTVDTSWGNISSGNGYVAWCWKAGTAWSNDASATGIGTLDSSGSVNATAGFSIISFTGTETSNQSVAHGLGAVPELIISKSRDVVDNWMVYHGTYSSQQYQSLNLTTAVASSANIWTSLPTSTVINIGDNAGVNDNGAMIMYAFRSVPGFSKFGSYTGNGSTDGTFVYTGFKPAFLIVKRTDAADGWIMFDNKRSSFNIVDKNVQANSSNSETTYGYLDFTSNGFKLRMNGASANGSGANYIYMCFAENPFVSSTGVCATAR